MEEYRHFVERLVLRGEEASLQLHDPTHAAIVAAKLFQQAENHVRILTENLYLQVYGNQEVLNAAKAFLIARKEASLEILLEDSLDIAEHPFIAELAKSNLAGTITIRRVPPNISARYAYNFILADEHSFRFEQDRTRHNAYVAFNQSDLAAKVKKTFDQIAAQSETVALPPKPRAAI